MTVGARQTLDPSLRAGLLALRAEIAKEKLVEDKSSELKVDEKAPLVPEALQELEPVKPPKVSEKEVEAREPLEEKALKPLESLQLAPEGRMSMGRMSLGCRSAAEAVVEARESLAQALRQAKQGRVELPALREQRVEEEIEPVSLEPRESLAKKVREATAFGSSNE